MPKVLVYGEQDLNLVDGSSVWQASLIEVLAGIPNTRVDVLLRTPLRRRILVDELERLPAVRFWDPWQGLTDTRRPRGERLASDEAALIVDLLHERESYDAIVLRAPKVALELLQAPATLARCWIYLTRDGSLAGSDGEVRRLLAGCRRVLCQTPEVREALRAKLVDVPSDRVTILPPMIRPWAGTLPRYVAGEPFRLCYSGKFSADYLIEETVAAFAAARDELPFLELHVFGDKFHGDEGFERRVRHAFAMTPGLHWHGAKPRHLVNEALSHCHAGLSWRSSAYDDSQELSTKVLEYATLGLPALLNPVPIQRRVFGDDYPGYVRTAADIRAAITALTASPSVYASIQAHVRGVAEGYGYPTASRTLGAALSSDAATAAAAPRCRTLRVLIAGHDLKFAGHIVRYFRDRRGDRVEIDAWAGHDQAETPERRQRAERADLIWCEWCLGNAVYYSHHKRPQQRLIVRLHHQEMMLPFRQRVDWRRVDALLAICNHHYDRLLHDIQERRGIVRQLPNLIDAEALAFPKLPGTEFRIGFMGSSPQRKRLDLAIDILERLRIVDSRYSLSIKGRQPWEFDWLWNNPEQRTWYEALYDRIRDVPGVHFEGFGDVAEWFRSVGVVLSTSDEEGSHQAVAEGMASGCVPCIRNWDGADRLYPAEYVYRDPAEAAAMILRHRAELPRRAAACREYARREFDYRTLFGRLDGLLAEILP